MKALLQTWSQRRALDPRLWGHSSVQRAGGQGWGWGARLPVQLGAKSEGVKAASGLTGPCHRPWSRGAEAG